MSIASSHLVVAVDSASAETIKKPKHNAMGDTVAYGMQIVLTMLRRGVTALQRPQAMREMLACGPVSLLIDCVDETVRSKLQSQLVAMSETSAPAATVIFSTLCEPAFQPQPGSTSALQYFEVLDHLQQKHVPIRQSLLQEMVAYIIAPDLVTEDDEPLALKIDLLNKMLKVDPEALPTLITTDEALVLSHKLCDCYLLSVPEAPICRKPASRKVTAALLATLANFDGSVMSQLYRRLVVFAASTPVPAWDFKPRAKAFDLLVRHESGLAGLTNKGNTCYMNSVLQQLYAVPEVRSAVVTDTMLPGHSESGIRIRVKNKAKLLDHRFVAVWLKGPLLGQSGAERSDGAANGGTKTFCVSARLGYVSGQQKAGVTNVGHNSTNTSPLSGVLVTGNYLIRVTNADDHEEELMAFQPISLVTNDTRKASFTLELVGENELRAVVARKQLPRMLQRCLYALMHSKTAVFDTGDMCNACEELREFSPYTLEGGIHRQQDAAEFVTVLLDYLESEMKDTELAARLKSLLSRKVTTLWVSKEDGHVGELFKCSTETATGPYSVDISDMEGGGSLEQCLERGCQENPDVFSGIDADWGQTDATRTVVLSEAPKIFMVALGRFKYNMETNRTEKLNYRIEFPQQLDLFNYSHEAALARRRQAGLDGCPPET
eukprot:SAG11_NODE_2941_length_2821_cov_1.310801_2_plen_661_part_01